jgi:predicted transcriptional regulator
MPATRFCRITTHELNCRLAELPAFSLEVYNAIDQILYEEPNFSDVTVDDIAKALNRTPTAIGGALKKLVHAGLVLIEEYEVNDRSTNFLHTVGHSFSL